MSKQIDEIRKKYGEPMLRMGIDHVIGVGIQKKFISSRKRQRTLRKSFRCTCRGEALIK